MALRVDRTKRRRRQFYVYDLEWYPENYETRLVGLYDGKRYTHWDNVLDFLKTILTRPYRDSIFFAHAGGLADVQFILETVLERRNPELRVEASFSGSSAIIVRLELGGHSWTFCDSYWLLRDKLEKIGNSLGIEKYVDYRCSNYPGCGHKVSGSGKYVCDCGAVDWDGQLKFCVKCLKAMRWDGNTQCIFYAPMGELLVRNEQDCVILHRAIDRFQEELLHLGGELQMTVASCALKLFKCAFLKHDIPTDKHINDRCRTAYVASRVEVLSRECRGANYFDINSSFPYSMTKPQPGRALGETGPYREGTSLALVEATVNIPAGSLVKGIPPLPYRQGQRVFFPTGRFRSRFMAADLDLLVEGGGRIETIWDVCHFAPFSDLAEYVFTVYELRKKAPDDFLKLLYKYLLNSLYGKFGECDLKEALLINPKKIPKCQKLEDCREGHCRCRRLIRPGMWLVSKKVDVKHEHVPISANITALSRGLITRHLWNAPDAFYCDTDSIVTSGNLPTGIELGQLKHEQVVDHGVFLAPKLYKISPGDKGAPYKIRAKGFRGLTEAEFDALGMGSPVEITRMLRLKELYNSGQGDHPREIKMLKSARMVERPKREVLTNGKTRPWSVEELQEDTA